MKKLLKRAAALLMLALLAHNAAAVPAYPERVLFRQPGDRDITVTIYLKGDERVHWAETEDGYSLLHDDDGSLVYATLNSDGDMVATEMLATEVSARSLEVVNFLKQTPKHLRFSKRQIEDMLSIWRQVEAAKSGPKTMSDVTGEKRFLVILFDFQDKHFCHGKYAFKLLFNQLNYSTNGNTGSVRDYYRDASGGLFTLKMDVAGPYRGAFNMAYYGATDYGYQAFAREAVDSAANDVDFSLYDNDHDGYIDGLHIIFAGYGEEAGGGSDCIWSHKWNIFDAPTYNNTVIDVYSCSPECAGNAGDDLTAIGVICHELGHVFGAPDYYDTDYESSGGEYPGLGKWDIMSGGSWNHGGKTPAHHNPYTKIYIYHWTTCDTIDSSPATYVMDPTDVTIDGVHRVNTSTAGDFFLIENRQPIKWDANLPGHGMIVYHVHPDAYGSHVDNSSHPQQIYILAKTSSVDTFPNSTPSSYGSVNSSNASFPGDARRDSLTDNSVPWFRPWSKQPNNLPLTNISENTSTKKIYFTVNMTPEVTGAYAEGSGNNSVFVEWTRYGGNATLVLMSSDSSGFGLPDRTYMVGESVAGGGTVVYSGNGSFVDVDSLTAGSRYYFKIFVKLSGTTYSDGVVVSATTLNCALSDWETESFDNTPVGALPDCWTGEWAVDSIGGQQALASGLSDGDGRWTKVSSKPIIFDTTDYAVLHYRLHFGGAWSDATRVRTEYRKSAGSPWVLLDSAAWNFGMAEWTDVWLQLADAGNSSRLRFSLFSDGSGRAAVDDVDVTPGSLIVSECDNNGTISPRGCSVLRDGDTIEYTMNPLPGYELKKLQLDGSNISPQTIRLNDDGTSTWLLFGRRGRHVLSASFERKAGVTSAAAEPVRVFPNPTGGTLSVTAPDGELLSLYDMMGRLVLQRTALGSGTVLDLGGLAPGIYLLRAGSSTVKIVRK